jgi:hypothetical protein
MAGGRRNGSGARIAPGSRARKSHYSNHPAPDGGETGHYRKLAVPPAWGHSFFIQTVVPEIAIIGQARSVRDPVASVRSPVEAAAGTSNRQCPQRYRDLTLIRIVKPNGCFSQFVSAGLDPLLPLTVTMFEWPILFSKQT